MFRVMLVAVVVVGCGPVPVDEERGRPETSTGEPFMSPVAAPRDLDARRGDHRVVEPGRLFVSRFGPSQGVVGTHVRVLGSGFSRVASENLVFVGSRRCGVQAEVVDANEGLLEFVIPEGAVTNQLTIVVGDQLIMTPESLTVLTHPLVYGVDPRTALVNTRDHVIGITGDGFVGSPGVWLDGQPLTVTQVTVGRLTAVVPFSLKTVARHAVLSVEGASSTLTLSIENPGPAIVSVTPSVLHARVDRVTVAGAGFMPSSVVLVDHAPVPTTWDSGALVAEVQALTAGDHLVMVQTPAPGGGVSAPFTLTVQ